MDKIILTGGELPDMLRPTSPCCRVCWTVGGKFIILELKTGLKVKLFQDNSLPIIQLKLESGEGILIGRTLLIRLMF